MNERIGLNTTPQARYGRDGWRSLQIEPVPFRSIWASARLTLPVLVLVALSLILAPTDAAAGSHDNHGNHTQLVWSVPWTATALSSW